MSFGENRPGRDRLGFRLGRLGQELRRVNRTDTGVLCWLPRRRRNYVARTLAERQKPASNLLRSGRSDPEIVWITHRLPACTGIELTPPVPPHRAVARPCRPGPPHARLPAREALNPIALLAGHRPVGQFRASWPWMGASPDWHLFGHTHVQTTARNAHVAVNPGG